MAGAGYRTWSATEVVTAANVQTYLMDQVCLVFADVTARNAITASEGMICYLKSIDQVQTYNGSAWVSVTSVLTGDVLTEDSTNLRVGVNESSPGAALHVEVKAGTTDQLVRLYARTGAEHDADLSFALDNGTGETYTIGIDDSDSDAFKISDGAALGTNDRMVIASSGAMTVAGGITTNITGNASGSSGSCTGLAATATALATGRTIGGTSFNGTANIVPGTITVADTTDTSCSVALFESATGDLAPKSDGGLTYNAGTGTLTATALAGPLTGNVTGNASGSSGSCTGNAATATNSTTVTVADTTDTSCSVAVFESATGSLGAKTDGGLTYNAGTGTLTATALAGPLTGNVTGNASGSSGSCTGNSATATVGTTVTVADTTDTSCSVGLFESATGNLGAKSDGGLTYNAGTGTLTATAFAGPLTGNVTGNASGTALTVTQAAQSAITSTGTLTGVTVSGTATIGVAVGQAVDLDRKTDNYTLVLADAGKVIEMNKGTAVNLTIPPNSSVAFPVGTQIVIVQLGAGQVTVVEGSGVTTRSDGDKAKIKTQYSSCVLIKHETNEWYILGNLAA